MNYELITKYIKNNQEYQDYKNGLVKFKSFNIEFCEELEAILNENQKLKNEINVQNNTTISNFTRGKVSNKNVACVRICKINGTYTGKNYRSLAYAKSGINPLIYSFLMHNNYEDIKNLYFNIIYEDGKIVNLEMISYAIQIAEKEIKEKKALLNCDPNWHFYGPDLKFWEDILEDLRKI